MANNKVNILLVEDNLAHAELIKRCFKQHRAAHRVQHLVDGQQAIDYLLGVGEYADRERFPLPHCILLDLRLPKVDGLEVLRIIKTSPGIKRIPTIVLTTSATEQDVARAYAYRANRDVVKSIDFDKFATLIDDLGSYWMMWNHNP